MIPALPPHVEGSGHVDRTDHTDRPVRPPRTAGPSRRLVLRGLGGAVLALPWLESVRPNRAGAGPSTPHPIVFLRQANGVQQADLGEPEQFWPRATGPLTTLATTDTDRAVSELAAYQDRLLLVRGTRFAYPGNGCGHSGGGNQCLTAARVSDDPAGNRSLALGESADNYVARHFPNNGGEPLTLYTGPRGGYIDEVLSYRGPLDLRAAEDDPYGAYLRMIGGETVDVLLDNRRRSVNDLVREQMTALMARPELSSADRARLQLHFDSIRDFEVLTCRLAEDEEQAMADLQGFGTLNDNRVTVAKMHCDLIALAFACDFARSATLQIGDGNDGTEYTIDGVRLPNFHMISHRIYDHGSDGDPIDGAVQMHHDVDRLHLEIFRHLLDKLDEAGLLDTSVAVLTNDLGAGVSHTYRNIPWVIAGAGDGLLRQGAYVDVGDVTHNQVLSTLISATGLRKAGGGLVDDFGDPDLTPGTLSEMLA